MRTLIVGLTLAAGALAALALAPAIAAEDRALGKHPHFDDGGALPWATSLSQAQAAARKSGKLIFIEFGREA